MFSKIASEVLLLVCLLKHVLAVPMSDLFSLAEQSGSFTTLGPAEESDCMEHPIRFRGGNRNRICVSFYIVTTVD